MAAVRSCLNPYYKAGRIATREDYKHLAQRFVARVVNKKERGNTRFTDGTPKRIAKYIDRYFLKFKRYERGKQPELLTAAGGDDDDDAAANSSDDGAAPPPPPLPPPPHPAS